MNSEKRFAQPNRNDKHDSASLTAVKSNLVVALFSLPILFVLDLFTPLPVSYEGFFIGAVMSILNLCLLRRVVETLFVGNGGLLSVVVGLAKLPLLLVVLYFVSLRGSTVMAWCIVGLLTLVPAALISEKHSITGSCKEHRR